MAQSWFIETDNAFCYAPLVSDHDLNSSRTGIQLAGGQSASKVFYEILKATIETFPNAFADLQFPGQPGQFKKRYIDLLPDFESLRLKSNARHDIAEALAHRTNESMTFSDRSITEPLSKYLHRDFSPLPVYSEPPNSNKFLLPRVSYENSDWTNLDKLADKLLDRDVISQGAANALCWLQENLPTDGTVSLSDRKVVALGANAEMASTRQFLDAGANVLWIDRVPPPAMLVESPTRSGNLSWVAEADLLQQPGEILATIKDFAGDEPVDLCLYAYAPGQARELKLTLSMNAIIEALPRQLIRSITLLLSPTTATPLDSRDSRAMQSRRLNRPGWENLLDAAGLLGKGVDPAHPLVSRTLVSIQGASYQAAQYLGKLMTAESWANRGQTSSADSQPIQVSANTAAITRTRSMSHPAFAAAFEGARAFQVETFTPSQSQDLNGLLTIQDWMNPAPSTPADVRVHGGIHTLPSPLESALRIAVAIGVARSPRLLPGLLLSLLR